MGLNFVKRPPREELDSPNDFITVALGQTDPEFANHDEQLIYEFYDKVLDEVDEERLNLEF